MRRRRKPVAVCAGVLVLAGLVVLWPWSEVRDVRAADLTVSFVVTDAETGAPVHGTHVALHDEAGSAMIVRTDADGIVAIKRRCTVTRYSRENPLSGVRWRSRETAALPNWHVVMTAGGYRPPDPWRLWDRIAPALEVEGDSVGVTIPVVLIPHSRTP